MSNAIVPQSNPNSQPTIFNFGDIAIRTFTGMDGEPRFVAADVCKALGISKPENAYARLDDDEKDTCQMDTLGGRQQMVIITESGLYNLILRSDKPQAKVFKKWITSEVLPAIRKTGVYLNHPMSPGDMLVAMGEAMREFERRDAQRQREITEVRVILANEVTTRENETRTINARLDNAEWFRVVTYCDLQAIKHTPALRQKWGRDAAVLSRERGIQIRKQEVEGKRWQAENLYHQSILADVCGKVPPKPGQPLLID